MKSNNKDWRVPLWIPINRVKFYFGVGEKRISNWTGEGLIRTVKLNNSKSGSRLYYAPDINDLLLKTSAGWAPRVKLGKVK